MLVVKVYCDELVLGGIGKYSVFGLIINLFDLSRLVGGLFSGFVVILIKNVVFLLGLDIGDLVCLFVSYNGFVGFKFSYGVISRFGLFVFVFSLDIVVYFVYNVSDIVVLL